MCLDASLLQLIRPQLQGCRWWWPCWVPSMRALARMGSCLSQVSPRRWKSSRVYTRLSTSSLAPCGCAPVMAFSEAYSGVPQKLAGWSRSIRGSAAANPKSMTWMLSAAPSGPKVKLPAHITVSRAGYSVDWTGWPSSTYAATKSALGCQLLSAKQVAQAAALMFVLHDYAPRH